jgi:hypothetical protein
MITWEARSPLTRLMCSIRSLISVRHGCESLSALNRPCPSRHRRGTELASIGGARRSIFWGPMVPSTTRPRARMLRPGLPKKGLRWPLLSVVWPLRAGAALWRGDLGSYPGSSCVDHDVLQPAYEELLGDTPAPLSGTILPNAVGRRSVNPSVGYP